MANNDMHKSYMKHSDYYASIVEAKGRKLDPIVAEFICMENGVPLHTLDIQPGADDRYDTLELVMELGY